MTDDHHAVPILEPSSAYALWAADYPPHAHNPLMQAEERAMLSLLPAGLRGRAVLDAGCGSGRYLIHTLQRGARRVVGLDLSAEMLARASAPPPPPHPTTAAALRIDTGEPRRHPAAG
jgi:malonyl-CoA O-methyltransferase